MNWKDDIALMVACALALWVYWEVTQPRIR